MELGKLAFVGGGAMAEAIARGVIKHGLVREGDVTVGEPLQARRHALASDLGVTTTSDNAAAVSGAGIVVLAVKPQTATAVLSALRDSIKPNQTVLSIVAGLTIDGIQRLLGHNAIVRVMPNTPAQVGEGMSVWTATEAVTSGAKDDVRALLGSLGREIEVPSEHYLDMATAMNGSGPGFVLLFIEAMIDAGVGIGFSRQVSEELTYQTVIGSVVLARQSGRHPAELRNQVTSPAGTTAAGIRELEDGRLRSVVDRAVRAAYERCLELGKS